MELAVRPRVRYQHLLEMSDLIVVKVGTGVLTRVSDGRIDGGSLVKLVTALAEQVNGGQRVVLVSSGAVGSGVSALGMAQYPTELSEKQAAAAVGQARLMHTYENLFSQFGLECGADSFDGRQFAERRSASAGEKYHQLLVRQRWSGAHCESE